MTVDVPPFLTVLPLPLPLMPTPCGKLEGSTSERDLARLGADRGHVELQAGLGGRELVRGGGTRVSARRGGDSEGRDQRARARSRTSSACLGLRRGTRERSEDAASPGEPVAPPLVVERGDVHALALEWIIQCGLSAIPTWTMFASVALALKRASPKKIRSPGRRSSRRMRCDLGISPAICAAVRPPMSPTGCRELEDAPHEAGAVVAAVGLVADRRTTRASVSPPQM